MFQTQTLLKMLSVMEEDLDVNQFVVDGFHLWPVLRFTLAQKLQDHDAHQSGPENIRAAEAHIEKRFDALIAAAPPRPDIAPHDLTSIVPTIRAPQGRGIFFATRPEDHSLRTPAGFYAPVLDPWIELARGTWPCVKSELITARYNDLQPRHFFTFGSINQTHSQMGLDDIVACYAVMKVGKSIIAAVKEWFERELQITWPALDDVFETDIVRLWQDKQVYREMLKATQPALVLTSCFYLPPSLSAVWAARELGIPVADVQHGGNGASHMGYTHWRNIPTQGYYALPDYFFVWDSLSANNLLRWFPQSTPAHQVIVTGRFGLAHAARAAANPQATSALEAAVKGAEKVILVSLQPLESAGLSPVILEAMRRAPDTWTWLVRSHPIAKTLNHTHMLPDALEKTMRSAGIKRFDAQQATALPLAQILPHVTHHLTGFSGTSLECAVFNIRTTFTHIGVWSFFKNLIDMGIADFADTPEAVLQSISNDKPFPDVSGELFIPRDDATAMAALTHIMGTK